MHACDKRYFVTYVFVFLTLHHWFRIVERRLPPLNALRAFEAAARHESFSRAAQELHVTHAAVSHQIKALEDWLGMPLFQRLTRAVRLSDAGRSYLAVVHSAFNQIHAGTLTLLRSKFDQPLNVTTTPAFAVRWLAPRLGRLWSAHPDLDLRVHEVSWMVDVDFTGTNVDIAVRIGGENWPGLEAVPLMPGTVTPMCSPTLPHDGPPLKRPEDLAHHKLLHEFDYSAWRRWFDRADIRDFDVEHGPVFDDINLVYSAALAGQGVGLLHTALTRKEMVAGQLIQPFDSLPEEDMGYYIVYPPGRGNEPLIAAFRDWLLVQAAKERPVE